ncbi:hypothetical protein Vqi01_42940 [Micromonospora qiuiae]|uniref:Uncharacterized protein n=1 Tax=Micromonospora qiuiae TaxID=502268 RepID=A0ABQ4JFP0_9ACTN|nr:hypothetical protein Vqi01_42940 [Micromonospora qiuiae]
MPHRDQLQREPKPVVITPPPADQLPIRVIQEEEPLHSRLVQRLGPEPAVRGNLLIRQEPARHEPSKYGTSTHITSPGLTPDSRPLVLKGRDEGRTDRY